MRTHFIFIKILLLKIHELNNNVLGILLRMTIVLKKIIRLINLNNMISFIACRIYQVTNYTFNVFFQSRLQLT